MASARAGLAAGSKLCSPQPPTCACRPPGRGLWIGFGVGVGVTAGGCYLYLSALKKDELSPAGAALVHNRQRARRWAAAGSCTCTAFAFCWIHMRVHADGGPHISAWVQGGKPGHVNLTLEMLPCDVAFCCCRATAAFAGAKTAARHAALAFGARGIWKGGGNRGHGVHAHGCVHVRVCVCGVRARARTHGCIARCCAHRRMLALALTCPACSR